MSCAVALHSVGVKSVLGDYVDVHLRTIFMLFGVEFCFAANFHSMYLVEVFRSFSCLSKKKKNKK